MIRDRARGSLIGLAIGDAMGAPTEGMTPSTIRETFGWVSELQEGAAGTDDTEYAVLTARALLRHGVGLTSEQVAGVWREAVDSQSGGFHGAGFSEMVAIANLQNGLLPPKTGEHSYERWSDGAAMRAAPIGIVAAGNPTEAARLAGIDARVSHWGDGVYCAQAIAAGVATALVVDEPDLVVLAVVNALPRESWSFRVVSRAIELGSRHGSAADAISDLYDEISIFEYPWADAAPEATALALGIFAAAKGQFEDAVTASVNLGRDTDTIAAMNGALCGALSGYEALPTRWREPVRAVTGRCIADTAGTDLIDTADALVALNMTYSAKGGDHD